MQGKFVYNGEKKRIYIDYNIIFIVLIRLYCKITKNEMF